MATYKGTDQDDYLIGSDEDDIIEGLAGDDLIDGGLGADRIYGGDGSDRIVFTAVRRSTATPLIGLIDGGAGTDIIDLRAATPATMGTIETAPGVYATGVYVGSQRFELRGVETVLFGNGADDISYMPGLASPIELRAGAGNDRFIIEPLGNGGRVAAFGEDGNDSFFVSGKFGGQDVTGILDGGAGKNTLRLNISFTVDLAAGQAISGNARYSVASFEDVRAAAIRGFITTVKGDDADNHFDVNPGLDDGTPVIFDGRGGDDTLIGGRGDDTLTGGSGDDRLFGNNGADMMMGGSGNDYYAVSDIGDVVIELDGEGMDEVSVHLSTYTLPENIEILQAGSGSNFSGTGNASDNIMRGGHLNDKLYGLDGDDELSGGNGQDQLFGGSGDDTYYLITMGDSQDVIIEAVDGGIDEIVIRGSFFTLATNVENARATDDSSNVFLTGNASDNTLRGSAVNDSLDGAAGADTLIGGAGNDFYYIDDPRDVIVEVEDASGGDSDAVVTGMSRYTLQRGVEIVNGTDAKQLLIGNEEANWLVSGGGADTLIGLTGDDLYEVGGGDRIVELANGGTDSVRTKLASYVLGQNLEDLQGIDFFNGQRLVGNAGDNRIIGSFSHDTLDGRAGIDVLTGGFGDDAYVVDDARDVTLELAGQGIDEVRASVDHTLSANIERLTLIGRARGGNGNALDNTILGGGGADTLFGFDGNDSIQGNDGGDQIDGGAGDDLIFGGLGRDVMTGGAGADRFTFRDGDSGATAATADRILDFSRVEGDRISLGAVDANEVPPDTAFTFIGTAALSQIAGQLRYGFFGGDTVIEGDTNGDGLADLVIRLSGNIVLVAGDFVL